VPDPFAEAFANIGADFSEFMAGAAAAAVTVRQINPDDGGTIATATNVTALKRSRRRQPFGVASGAELGSDQCRFILRASEVGFLVKARDEILDADGVTWHIQSVSAIAFNQLYVCDVGLKR
jgi:hypothetical protein